ncbi:MAG: hypothetical protein II985_01170 [Alistipes sp.]|nr:hypothetical protein [Alistipes sp.]
MRLINYCCAAFLLSLSAMLYGCELTETPSSGDSLTPELHITTTKLTVGGEGGGYVVDYSVKHRIDGVMPEVELLSDWVDNVEVTATQICFRVLPNNLREERTTRLKVTYEGADSHSIYITQGEMVLNQFAIATTELTPDKFTVAWTPSDQTMLYIPNIISVDYFTMSGVDTEEQFIAEEIKYFFNVAQGANLTLEELLTRVDKVVSGEFTSTYMGLMPGSRYLAYAYGISLDGDEYEITTPLHYELIAIPMQELLPAQFNIRTTATGMSSIRIDVEPVTWNSHYVIQVIPSTSMYYVPAGEQLPMLSIKGMHNTFFNQVKSYMSGGNTSQQYLDKFCRRGVSGDTLQLEKGEYMVAVFGVGAVEGGVAMMRTMPQVSHFTI